MPYAPAGPCSYPRCAGRAINGGRCALHQRPRVEPAARVDPRPNATARGYGARWREARAGYLKRHPVCACGAPATVVDHIRSHRGDMALFWDKANWQPMCKPCHDRKTATVDTTFARRGQGQPRTGGAPRPETAAQFAVRTRDHDRAGLRVVHVCGAVATGKSTVRRLLDERLGLPTFSIDEERAAIIGRRGAWVTDDEELTAWVRLEDAMLAQRACVIETSGRARNVAPLLAGVRVFTVLCTAPEAVRYERLLDRTRGPYFLPMSADYVARMMRIGRPNVAADFEWDSTDASPALLARLAAAVAEFLSDGESAGE